jgi:hypothetical protein
MALQSFNEGAALLERHMRQFLGDHPTLSAAEALTRFAPCGGSDHSLDEVGLQLGATQDVLVEADRLVVGVYEFGLNFRVYK